MIFHIKNVISFIKAATLNINKLIISNLILRFIYIKYSQLLIEIIDIVKSSKVFNFFIIMIKLFFYQKLNYFI